MVENEVTELAASRWEPIDPLAGSVYKSTVLVCQLMLGS
jgi:hypothetical protein